MGIFRSNDPAAFDDLDGIVVDETAPPSSIQGARTNVVILVGHFERGPHTLEPMGSIGEVQEAYGANSTYSGLKQLKSKKFGALKIIRIEAGSSAKGTLTLDDAGAVDTLKFDAKYKGVYGNSIQVKVEAGTTTGKKYTIKDTSATAVLPQEVYDNVTIATVASLGTFSESRLVDATVLSTAAEPANVAFTALASGSDGTVADADYQAAIAKAEVEGAGNFLFLDSYNDVRNGYLKVHAAATEDKMVICANSESATTATAVSDALSDVASLRDSAGRIIYAFNEPKTNINGVDEFTSPASWAASVLSQTGPNIDPSFAANTQFLAGITSLKHTLTRTQFIALKDAGIMAFEFDSDIGYKIKSGIVTQIADSSKITVLRRRMADFLTNSAARFMKAYQGAVNSKDNRTAVNGAIRGFVATQEGLGVLPKDSEVKGGKAKLVDTESANTDLTIGQGMFIIIWKQRIYSSMRYIVLRAQIGETVVVTEE